MNASAVAEILGVPASSVREWIRSGALDALDHKRGPRWAAMLTADDALVGALILELQRQLGAKSPLVHEVARAAAPHLQGLLAFRPGAAFGIVVAYGGDVELVVTIPADVVEHLRARLAVRSSTRRPVR